MSQPPTEQELADFELDLKMQQLERQKPMDGFRRVNESQEPKRMNGYLQTGDEPTEQLK